MKFIIDVPEGNKTYCEHCPFAKNDNVCEYLFGNDICIKCDLTKLHIEELNDTI